MFDFVGGQLWSWWSLLTVLLFGLFGLIWRLYYVRNKGSFLPSNILSEALVKNVAELVGSPIPGVRYRFRKREKIAFYSAKILRKVKSLSNVSAVIGEKGKKIKKRERMLGFAKKILRIPREPPVTKTVHKKPSSAFFDPIIEQLPDSVTPEVFYMLKSIRCFGHFEDPFFLQLCKHVQRIYRKAGEVLFEPGDPDDSIYVVESGKIALCVRMENLKEPLRPPLNVLVKTVEKGDSIISMLSIMDVLTGHSGIFKTVNAKAVVDSVILQLGAEAFSEIYNRYPESWVRAVQVVMMRLQRVTLTTLHSYLGLSLELITPDLRDRSRYQQHPPIGALPTAHSVDATTMPRHHSMTNDPAIAQMSARVRRDIHRKSIAGGDEHCITPIVTGITTASTAASADRRGTEGAIVSVSASSSQPQPKSTPQADLASCLGLKDPQLLEGKIVCRDCAPGVILTEQGSNEVSLIYVVNGALDMLQKTVGDDVQQEVCTAIINPGELFGGLAVLNGEPSLYTVKVRKMSKLLMISRDDCYSIMRVEPKVVLNMAHAVVRRMSPFLRAVDFALDSRMVSTGEAIFQQGDSADSLYVTLCGRLRAVVTRPPLPGHREVRKEVREEYGRGDIIGLFEVLTESVRPSTVMAIRYSELAKLPQGLWSLIKLKYPQTLERMFRILGKLLAGSGVPSPSMGLTSATNVDPSLPPNVTNLNTIAIVGVTPDVPVTTFAYELYHAMSSLGSCLHLNSSNIKTLAAPNALESFNDIQLVNWLSHQEEKYHIVLYECDLDMTTWTRRCIKQADCILIVALGEDEPTVGAVEKQFEQLTVRAQKDLVILWPEGTRMPRRTADWLNVRDWVSSHYHIRCPKRMFRRRGGAGCKTILEMYDTNVFPQDADPFSDFSRIARTLTGQSIGLCLGGGGARGAAHIGILRSLKESGIPVDFVGGVSIGAFIGALYALHLEIAQVTQRARDFFKEMGSWWNRLCDLTYPHAAFLTGAGFNRALKHVFDEIQIEDLWVPYFCITTDITASEMRVHRTGMLWSYVRASMSYASMVPPLCDPEDGHYLVDGCYVNNLPGSIWQYCRGSMTLSPHLPPICDPDDGHYLVDGGYVNNLPADVMRNLGAQIVLAIDVGGEDEKDLYNFGDSLSGTWELINRYNPWGKPRKILGMADIQQRLAYVSCIRQLEVVKKAPYCHYIRPPIERYQTMDFGLFTDILNVGYAHGKELISVWKEKYMPASGLRTRNLSGDAVAVECVPFQPSRRSGFRTSSQIGLAKAIFCNATVTFTDLAAKVTQMPRHLPSVSESLFDDMDEEEEVSDFEAEDGGAISDAAQEQDEAVVEDEDGLCLQKTEDADGSRNRRSHSRSRSLSSISSEDHVKRGSSSDEEQEKVDESSKKIK